MKTVIEGIILGISETASIGPTNIEVIPLGSLILFANACKFGC